MSIHVVATAVAKPERVDEVYAKLQTLVEPIRNDPGCLSVWFVVSVDNPAEMVFIEEWKDQAAFERHLADPVITKGVEAVVDGLAEPLGLKRYRA